MNNSHWQAGGSISSGGIMKAVTALRATLVAAGFLALSTSSWAAGFINGKGCAVTQAQASNATLAEFTADCGSNPNNVTFSTNTLAFNDVSTPTETFQSFLNSNVPPVVGATFNGTLTGGTSDDGSLWEFSGSGIFTSGTIRHDDGISLYLDGSSVATFSSPGPSNATDSVTGVSGLHSFILIYGECCHSPAVLQSTIVTPVPEPNQVGLLLFGLLAGTMLLRRKFAPSQQ
jgi:hypothetical protein